MAVTMTGYAAVIHCRGQFDLMGNKKDKQVEKLEKLFEVMTTLVGEEFTGHIKINFTQGGVGRIEKFEEILKVAAN